MVDCIWSVLREPKMNKRPLKSKSLSRDFYGDEEGAILIWFAVIVTLLIGLIGLALEGASLMNLNSQMQGMADSAAIAGAKDLDGSKGAIARATASAAGSAGADSNYPSWSNIASTGGPIITVTFYSALKSTGTTPVPADVPTTSDADAKYIRVVTESRGITINLLKALGITGNAYTRATATAKVDYVTCRPIQSFFCNPFEKGDTFHNPPIPAETYPGAATNFPENAKVGQMFALVSGSGAPGNWGLIEPASRKGGRGATESEFWAASIQDTCTIGKPGTGVGTLPGDTAKLGVQGINVRFDSPFGTGDSSLSSPVVITGYKPMNDKGDCKHYEVTSTGSGAVVNSVMPPGFDPSNYSATCDGSTGTYSCPLPRDRVFEKTFDSGSAFSSGLVWGQGANETDLENYWKNHHGQDLPELPDGVAPRWYLYNKEVTDKSLPWPSDAVEPHVPGQSATGGGHTEVACTASTAGTPLRRLIDVAVVDCDYWSTTGSSELPPITMNAQFFITEPARVTNGGGSTQISIWGELVSTSSANSGSGAVHQVVTLVR